MERDTASGVPFRSIAICSALTASGRHGLLERGSGASDSYSTSETLPRLMKYNGVDPARFPFYLKELEFEYNYRDADLFDQLIETLGKYTRVAVTE